MILETIVFAVKGTHEEQQVVLNKVFTLLSDEPNVTAIIESGYKELNE